MMIRIGDLVREDLVVFDLEAKTQKEVFEKVVCSLVNCDCMPSDSQTELCKRLGEREELGSTAVGHGIAIPHAYFDEIPEPLIVFARLKKAVAFGSQPPQKVDMVFLMAGPYRNDTEHLMILARLSRLLKDESFRKRLAGLTSGKEFVDAVNQAERRH
jgi:mannitol/fructose-specific phosphotransferase system IIA component (Ntr-type)